MICTVSGVAMARLLARATSSAGIYSDITLCSPFVGPAFVPRLRELRAAGAGSTCVVTIITSQPGAGSLQAVAREFSRHVRLLVWDRVHTKAYSMRARQRRQHSEALVTSANLTRAGLSTSDELGVHIIRGTSTSGRQLRADQSFAAATHHSMISRTL